MYKTGIAISILLFLYSTFLFAQSTVFSPELPAIKSHVPIKIMDENGKSFCVLRYNKKIHDFTFERRDKKTFQISLFKNLQLDSINANWFDYENLNYLAFVHQHKFYFLFEKTLNKKKSIYIKSIDSTGKSSNFKELAFVEKDDLDKDFALVFSRTEENKILLVTEHYYQNNSAKKVVLLYDPVQDKNNFLVKLPLENQSTGYSNSYACMGNMLYYAMSLTSSAGYRKQFLVNQEVLLQVFDTRLVSVNFFNLENLSFGKIDPCLQHKMEIKSMLLLPCHEGIALFLHYLADNNANGKTPAFTNQMFSNNLSKMIYCKTYNLDSIIKKQLTFYDGSNSAEVGEKNYSLYKVLKVKDKLYQVVERSADNNYNEMIVWQSNLSTGEVMNQFVVPRKTYYLRNQTRFKQIESCAFIPLNEGLSVFLLEDKANIKMSANSFSFENTKKLKHLWAGAFMQYNIDGKLETSKKVIFKNGTYNAIPINYEGNPNTFIYYLNKKNKEKFAILTR